MLWWLVLSLIALHRRRSRLYLPQVPWLAEALRQRPAPAGDD